MNTIQTTTPAQVVAPVGQTPPLQNQTAVDQTTTYNEGNGVMDTIVMTGPLSEIYTRALGVYFAKKPLDESALATESQAMAAARNAVISTSADAGLREIANAVTLVTPQEVMGNVDATVYAVDYSQIDRPEVIDAMHRLRDRATASGVDYVMAAVVEPLKEVTPCWQGTNAVYEISPVENSLVRGADGSFIVAHESYCGSLGFPIVYGLEGLAHWLIDRQAKKGNKAALEHLKPAKEGFFDKVKSVFKKKEADKGLFEKANELLQGDEPVTIHLDNRYFGPMGNPAAFFKALGEFEGYMNHLVPHTKALVANMHKHLELMMDLNTSADLGGVAGDNYKRFFPEMEPIYNEYAKLATAKYFPRQSGSGMDVQYGMSNGGLYYGLDSKVDLKFPKEMIKPNLRQFDDLSSQPFAQVPAMGPTWTENRQEGESVIVLQGPDKKKFLQFFKKHQYTANNLLQSHDELMDHDALKNEVMYEGSAHDEDEAWQRYVYGINGWLYNNVVERHFVTYLLYAENMMEVLAGAVRKSKPTHAMESFRIERPGVATEGFTDFVKKMFGVPKAEKLVKQAPAHETPQQQLEAAKSAVGNAIAGLKEEDVTLSLEAGEAKTYKDVMKLIDWFNGALAKAKDTVNTNVTNQEKLTRAYVPFIMENADPVTENKKLVAIVKSIQQQQPGLYNGMKYSKDGKVTSLYGPFDYTQVRVMAMEIENVIEKDEFGEDEDKWTTDFYPYAWAYGQRGDENKKTVQIKMAPSEHRAFLEALAELIDNVVKAEDVLNSVDGSAEFEATGKIIEDFPEEWGDYLYELVKSYRRNGMCWGMYTITESATRFVRHNAKA